MSNIDMIQRQSPRLSTSHCSSRSGVRERATVFGNGVADSDGDIATKLLGTPAFATLPPPLWCVYWEADPSPQSHPHRERAKGSTWSREVPRRGTRNSGSWIICTYSWSWVCSRLRERVRKPLGLVAQPLSTVFEMLLAFAHCPH